MKEQPSQKIHLEPLEEPPRRPRNNRVVVLICCVAAVVLVVVLMLLMGPPQSAEPTPSATPAQTAPQSTPTVDAALGEAALAGDVELATDEDTLAGLTGEDSAIFEQKRDPNIRKIGVTSIQEYKAQRHVLQALEHAGTAAVDSGDLDDFFIYTARGSENQQIQDVYTMINNGVSVMIVVDASTYNFGKIAEIARANDVLLVAYNIDVQDGFAVNLRHTADPTAELVAGLAEAGVRQTMTLGATPAQNAAIKDTLDVRASYTDMWDLVYQIRVSTEGNAQPEAAAEEGEEAEETAPPVPLESAMVYDYNANDILRTWLRAGAPPRAMAGTATVAYIKTWYQLLNGGVEVELPATEEGAEPETITVAAAPEDFAGFAFTTPGNVGELLYGFAYRLAQGDTLENHVHELTDYDIITNSNLATYYQQVRDEESGLVMGGAEDVDIDAVFEGS